MINAMSVAYREKMTPASEPVGLPIPYVMVKPNEVPEFYYFPGVGMG